MRHVISILVDNEPGVLSRVSGLFSGRGFNIESLNVAETLDSSISRMTLVTRGNDQIIEQIIKQLNKLVNVVNVEDFREGEYVSRELALVKVTADAKARSEIMQICDIFRAKIVDVQRSELIVEVTGDESKIEKFFHLLEPFGVQEITRTGRVAMRRK